MKKRTKVILGILIGVPLVLLLAAHGCLYLMLSANSPANRMSDEENIAAVAKWTRLPAMPDTARDVDVQIRGSIFTYQIILKFELSQMELAAWLSRAELGDKEHHWRADKAGWVETPSYFDKCAGRKMLSYEVPAGTLYVDEANGIIIIDASWS